MKKQDIKKLSKDEVVKKTKAVTDVKKAAKPENDTVNDLPKKNPR